MAELIDIKRVSFDPKNMTAYVRIADNAPLFTSDDLEGTARVYRLLPHIVEHACLGDAGETFRDAMGNTELAHLLEHVTVELLAQTNLAGDMPAGRTWVDEVDDRTYQIELACPDDVLVAAALSCGVWILDWAYRGGGDPEPDVGAIVAGLAQLMDNVGNQGEDLVLDYNLQELIEESRGEDEEEESHEDDRLDDENESESEADEVLEVVEVKPDEYEPVEPEHEVAPEVVPQETSEVKQDVRPLWTPAPEVSSYTSRRTVARSTEFDDEIDRIMATFESTAVHEPLKDDDNGVTNQ